MRARYDQGWKEAIRTFFPHFLSFFFPSIAQHIDIPKGFEFLDKELGRISKKGVGGRKVDALVKAYLKDGQEQWLLIHIEVQGYPQEEFPKRMFIYNYRIFDRYDKEVVSLAVLTDEDPQFRPGPYHFGIGEFQIDMKYPVVKLLDYRGRWEDLERDTNPFSVVVMAHLKSQETRRRVGEKYRWKVRLTRMLYERGYGREEVLGLYRFIDMVISLPDDLEEAYHEEIIREEEVRGMEYITTAEKIGMRKGIQQGIRQGMLEEAREMVLEALEERFGHVPEDVERKVRGIGDRGILKRLHRHAIRCDSLDEFREKLGEL